MKRYKSRLLISFIAVLVLIMALAACGGGEEPTPTPEPAPPTAVPEPTEAPAPTDEPEPTDEPAPVVDLQEFSSDEAGLTMSYPSNWVSDSTIADFLIFASSQDAIDADEPGTTDGVALLLHGSTEDFETDDPVAAMETFIPEMDLGGEGLRGEITETTLNGNPAATAIVNGESDSGIPLTAYLAIVIDGDWAAILVGTSPTDVEDEYLDTFAAMADTIELREPVMVEKSGDMADMPESEGFLLYGDSVTVSLSEDGKDTWDFIGLEGEVIDLIVEPAVEDLDVVIDIMNDSGMSILDAPVDDSYGLEELIGFEVPASGTYFIIVESYNNTMGDYSITLAESGSIATEETDSEDSLEVSDAIMVAPGSALELSEIYASTVDGEGETILTFASKAREFADISVSPTSEELDVVIDVLDPFGTSLLNAPLDDSVDAEYIRVLRTPIDGEYSVVVTSYNGNPGNFEILVEESYLSNPASFISASSSLDEADESHEFPFYTYADELVVVQVDPEIDLDAVIRVYNDDTDEMIEEEDASTGFEEIVFFAPEDGNYSFRVVGYEGSVGSYDVTLIGSEFAYFELAVGDLVNGRFGENNLFEYYIGGSAGDTISFTAKTDDDIDLILKLIDFDDNVLVEADEGFTGDQETMSYTFEEDALFILQVSDFTESGAGEFVLSVD